MEKWVLMVSPNNYPNGDAGAVRDDAFANIYKSLGYTVVLLCQNRQSKKGEYNGHTYVSLFTEADGALDKAFRFASYKRRMVQIIKELELQYGIPQVIHLYDAPHNGIAFLKEYGHKNSIKMIHDSVEWYSAEEFKLGILDKSYILKNRLNTKLIDSKFIVIAISKYLEKHFMSRGCRVTRIPVIMDVKSMPICNDKYNNGEVRICYAGSPAKKDYLSKILEAVGRLDIESKRRLDVRIIGVTKEQVVTSSLADTSTLSEIDSCVHFMGRIPRAQVFEELSRANFTILVRPKNTRYAMAGFPTKVVESLSIGVPVICNYTSDLGEYLSDRENSIEIASESTEDIAKAIIIALNLTSNEWLSMRNNARELAERSFDYMNYSEIIAYLLGEFSTM